MQILLIVPRYNLKDKKDFTYFFPIGLGYISAVLKKAGYKVDCLNINHFDGKIKELVNQALDRKKYDIVCTGHLGIGYTIIEKIIDTVKNHETRPKIIIGGTLITSEPELMLDSLKPDFVVIGEGEITIVELLKCIEKNGDLRKVDGIGFFDEKGNKVFTKTRKPIEDLDSIPFPDYETLGFREYLNEESFEVFFHYFDHPRVYSILGSRGCPFQCTFCYHCLGPGYRVRSVDNLIQEITYAIEKYKINSLYMIDDLFASNKERLHDFCKKLKVLTKDIPDFKWCCSLWVSSINKETLSMLKESGCLYVAVGFESYSPIVLKSMRKNITPEQIDKAIKLCEEEGIILAANFIFGDTAETKETAKETLDYWKRRCNGQISLYFIQPYPGSEIFKRCIKKGIIKDKLEHIKNKMTSFNWLNMTDSMTDEEIVRLKNDILEARRKYIKYVLPSKIKKIKNKKYDLEVICPFCNHNMNYKNIIIDNRLLYAIGICCRDCKKRFFIVSNLYNLGIKHYEELDFFKRNYLLLRSKILKKLI
ncbi:MAG: radical SAM protein [Nanoarchaeota archaeon]|nr:radical SAM protein [Nanoarchaeota archaeon]